MQGVQNRGWHRVSAIQVSAVSITDNEKQTLSECYFWELNGIFKKYKLPLALEYWVCLNFMLQNFGTDDVSVCLCVCVHVSGWYCRRLPAFFAHLGAGSQAGKIHDCLYSCPPPSHVVSHAVTPRLAAAPCARWAGVGTCWKGKVLGAGQGLLGLVLRCPFLGY